MIYLLAKFTALFLLTALLGFALGYWFSRRKFVDVSESYEDLRKANLRSDATHWQKLWQRLDSLPAPKEPDFTNIHERIAGVTSAISSLPRPEPVSFASVEKRLDSLQDSISRIPLPLTPKEPDLRPLVERLDSLEASVKAIPTPEKPSISRPLPARSTVSKTGSRQFRSLRSLLRSISRPSQARSPVSRPALRQFRSLRSRLRSISPASPVRSPVSKPA